jgi:hypothetical protein
MSKRSDKFADRQKRRSQQGEEQGGQRKSALNFDKLKKDAGVDDIVFYKPKKTKGKERNRVDILPWLISEEWYHTLREVKGVNSEVEVGEDEGALIIPVHYDVGIGGDTVLCLSNAFGGKCCICDKMFDLMDKDKVKYEKQINKLRAKWRCFYNVFDHEDEEYEGIKIWDMSFHNFEKHVRRESRDSDEGSVPYASLDVGKIVSFKGVEDSMGKIKFIKAESIEFEDRDDEYDEDVMESTFKLDTALIIPTPEAVKKMFYHEEAEEEGGEEAEEEEMDEEEESSKKKKKKKKDELPEEFDEDEEDADKASAGDPEEEEEDEEEDEEITECPEEHEFGKDYDKEDDCEDCNQAAYDACEKAKKEMRKKKKEGSNKKEKKEKKDKKKKSFARK